MLPFAALPFTGMTTKLNTLNKIAGNTSSPKMPVLFVGHGNPMNAIHGPKAAEAISHTLHQRSLGNQRNMDYCHGKTQNDSRFRRISKRTI